MNTKLGNILPINQNAAPTKLQKPKQNREQRALSGSGTANNEHSGAGLDADADILKNGFLRAARVGSLNTLEDDLTTGWPGTFSRVSGQVRGSILGKFLGVLLKTLDGAHFGLNGGGSLDQKVHDVGEGTGVGQSGTELGGVHDLGSLSEHGNGKDNQGGEEFHVECEPDLSCVAEVHGFVAVIDQVGSAVGEVVLPLEGGDGRNSVESLIDLGLEGRPHPGFETLQLTEGSTVEAKEEPVDDEQGSQNAKNDWGAAAENSNGSDHRAETSDGLKDLGHETLIDGFHILGETVDDATGRVSVEPSHGCTKDTRESLIVESARSREDTEEDEDVDHDHQESSADTDTVVDTEPELDLLLELVRGPPGEPLVHHDGTGLLGKDGEGQSEYDLPSTSSPDVRPPGRATDGASGNILISNDASGGGAFGLSGLLRLGGFLSVGLLVGLLGALFDGADHLAEVAVLAVELGIGPLLDNSTIVQDDDVINLRKEAESLSDQNTGPAVESVEDAFLEDGASNAWVESSKGIIQQVDVGVGVDSAG